MTDQIRVVIETGAKKTFSSAIDWPGWSRPGKTPEAALETLAAYAGRYARALEPAGIDSGAVTEGKIEVVDRVPGTATTDFGAPDVPSDIERGSMSPEECERHIAILRACWAYFDDTATRVSEELRKGPRGGGRDRTKIIEHVFESERSYVRKIGVKTPTGVMLTPDGLAAHRDAVCEAIRTANADGRDMGKWTLRYFIRRAAWHVLDHAWEMEDKDLTSEAEG